MSHSTTPKHIARRTARCHAVRGGPRDITQFVISRCPPRSVLGNTSQDEPFYHSQAHCEADSEISRSTRRTTRYHVVRDITMSASQIAREQWSGSAILLLPSKLRGGLRDITNHVISRGLPRRLLGNNGQEVQFYYSQAHCEAFCAI